jgi:hypothetical protein
MQQNPHTSYYLQSSSHISLELLIKFLNCSLSANRVLVYLITLPQLRKLGKGKAIPVTGHEDLSRLPHFLDNQRVGHRLPPRKIPGTHFC